MKLAIDGMDGVGKSSVAKLLGKELNYPVYEQKLVENIGIDSVSYKNLVTHIRKSKNKSISPIFYTLKSLLDNEDENSIAVRSIVSMFYFEHDNVSSQFINNILSLGTVPDLIIILYAPVEERIKRIKKRNENDPDLFSKTALCEGYEIMLDFVKEYNLPYLGIDTTNLSLDQVAVLTKMLVEGYQNSINKGDYLNNMNQTYGFENFYKKGEKGYEKVLKKG